MKRISYKDQPIIDLDKFSCIKKGKCWNDAQCEIKFIPENSYAQIEYWIFNFIEDDLVQEEASFVYNQIIDMVSDFKLEEFKK